VSNAAGTIDQPAEGLPGRDQGHAAACLNCGAELAGDHCHACGQPAHVHRSLGAFWHDLAHGVLHFEGKIWRTLPMLALHPGQLTRRYIEGERARFLSPVALFLFSVFLMFAVFSIAGVGGSGGEVWNTRGEVGAALRHARADLVVLERAQAAGQEPMANDGPNISIGGSDDLGPMPERIAAARKAVTLLEEAEQAVTVARGVGPRASLPGFKRLEKGLNKLYENPSLALYKIQSSAYKYSWALIPLSVPLLWLLFPFSRRFQLYDHTVFITYSLCFMTLFAVLLSLLMAVGVSWLPVSVAAAIIPAIHMYRQLRGAYALRRFGAAWRAVLLMLFALLASGAFAFLLLLLGALG
jgi:nitrate reductase NapE component